METMLSPGLHHEQRPGSDHYSGTIFLSNAALWVMATLFWLLRPATSADVCDNAVGLDIMCCWWCDAFAWFTIVPILSFIFSLILFLPGFLIVRSIARRVTWWRSAYWIPGWVVAGVIAGILLMAVGVIISGQLIEVVIDLVVLMIGLGFFGLLCGIFYWLRDKRSGTRDSVRQELSRP